MEMLITEWTAKKRTLHDVGLGEAPGALHALRIQAAGRRGKQPLVRRGGAGGCLLRQRLRVFEPPLELLVRQLARGDGLAAAELRRAILPAASPPPAAGRMKSATYRSLRLVA